jgi:hypothetical protein
MLQRREASSGVRNPSRSSCDSCSARPGTEPSLPWLGGVVATGLEDEPVDGTGGVGHGGGGGRSRGGSMWPPPSSSQGSEQGRERADNTVVIAVDLRFRGRTLACTCLADAGRGRIKAEPVSRGARRKRLVKSWAPATSWSSSAPSRRGSLRFHHATPRSSSGGCGGWDCARSRKEREGPCFRENVRGAEGNCKM